MLLSKYNLIFIHPPKTAGNTIQSVLLPHSDDTMNTDGHRDGHDRFEVRGLITAKKHMTLAEYAERLGDRMQNYRIAMSVRDPIERAVSMYFSPHRWYRQVANGGYVLSEPTWDRDAFDAMLAEMPCLSDFVTINGVFHRPDFVIRQENMEDDLHAMCRAAGLPPETWRSSPGIRNKSAGQTAVIRELVRERALKRHIRDHFAKDFENFSY